jgi:hypothetical protein
MIKKTIFVLLLVSSCLSESLISQRVYLSGGSEGIGGEYLFDNPILTLNAGASLFAYATTLKDSNDYMYIPLSLHFGLGHLFPTHAMWTPYISLNFNDAIFYRNYKLDNPNSGFFHDTPAISVGADVFFKLKGIPFFATGFSVFSKYLDNQSQPAVGSEWHLLVCVLSRGLGEPDKVRLFRGLLP